MDFLNYTDANGSISESSRIYVAVMEKNKKKYEKTFGWGYQAFQGNSNNKLITNVYDSCVKCHVSQEKNNYVFSKFRE